MATSAFFGFSQLAGGACRNEMLARTLSEKVAPRQCDRCMVMAPVVLIDNGFAERGWGGTYLRSQSRWGSPGNVADDHYSCAGRWLSKQKVINEAPLIYVRLALNSLIKPASRLGSV